MSPPDRVIGQGRETPRRLIIDEDVGPRGARDREEADITLLILLAGRGLLAAQNLEGAGLTGDDLVELELVAAMRIPSCTSGSKGLMAFARL